MESIAQYTQIMTELKGADWAKENIRLTGYPSEIYAYWGESDHSTTRINGWYFDDAAFYGPDLEIVDGQIVYNTKLSDGDTYTLDCRGSAAGSSKQGYKYTVYDELYQEWALDKKGASVTAGAPAADQITSIQATAVANFYGYKVEGVYQSQEEINNSPKNKLATVTPGDLKFKDVNGDGEITTADRTMIGDPTPDITYGITLGVGYKNWELAVDMMGQGGNQIYRTWDNYNWSQFNFMAQRMDRWHGEGTSNTQPLLNSKHSINYLNSDYYIESGNFFRIRNVQLAYNFDKTLLSRIGVQALKLYANIQNLKTWKHNTGYTPELGGTAIAFGVDNGSYPMPVVYTFGFNLTF